MRGNPSEILRTRVRVSQILQRVPHMENPTVPELSFKPDFMVNIERQLIFLEIASVRPEESIDWKTLRLIEHLFEVKLFYGNKTNFNIVILDATHWKPYCVELLRNFFDKVICGPDFESADEIYTTPKESNFRLWDLEREFERSRYRQFKRVHLRRFGYREINGSKLEKDFSEMLLQSGLHFEQYYPVRNLKNYYLGIAMDLKFYFDFFVNEKIVEIKSFRKMTRVVLQNLLIKSRLIRYQKEDDLIRRAEIPISNMILFVNGDLDGPRYDEFRYLRMLTNAGWDVHPASDFQRFVMEGFR